jgi:hypothetical protein
MSKQVIKESTLVTSEDMTDSREEFRKYFVGLKRKLNLAPELENVLWLHLKTMGMDKKEKFNEGVEHFGYKI